MQGTDFAAEAQRYATMAASAPTLEERELFLSMERLWRKFANASHRINAVRARHGLAETH